MLVTVFSPEIARLLLGSEFCGGYTIMPIVLAGASAWGLSMFGHKGLELQEKTRVIGDKIFKKERNRKFELS